MYRVVTPDGELRRPDVHLRDNDEYGRQSHVEQHGAGRTRPGDRRVPAHARSRGPAGPESRPSKDGAVSIPGDRGFARGWTTAGGHLPSVGGARSRSRTGRLPMDAMTDATTQAGTGPTRNVGWDSGRLAAAAGF